MLSGHRRTLLVILLLGFDYGHLWAQQPGKPPAEAAGRQAELSVDPAEIVRQGLAQDQKDFGLARDYTYQQRVELKVLDTKGVVKRHRVYTDDVTILYGEPYFRRILKNDKPLSQSEARKEQEKLDRFVAKCANESPGQRQKRLARQEKDREQERAFAGDIMRAYDFHLDGSDIVDGRDVWMIEANPRSDFRPTLPDADILPKLKGKLWIDKKTSGWVKMDLQTLDTISWGFFIFRIHKGSEIELEQERLNHEIWLPRRISVHANARFALFVNGAFDWEVAYSHYKKFTSNVKVLAPDSQVKPSSKPNQP